MILFLKPYFERKIWAGNELNNIYDCPYDCGEAWIVSGYHKKSSVIANGKFKGQTLRHIWRKHPELFGEIAKNEKEFPILLKLISAKEDLSVQVHPNDDYALKKHNSLGKFECWYILDENKASYATLGINVNNAMDLREIINQNMIELFLDNKKIQKDDLVIVEPGCVHALHKGSFVLEIQESSDITYRLYDYNRNPSRELHINDSINVIKYNTKNSIHSFKNADEFDNDYFKLNKIFINSDTIYKNDGFSIFYVVDGRGFVNDKKIKKGDVFLVTVDSKEIEFNGNLEILRVLPKPKDKERLKMRKVALITGISGQDGYFLSDLLLEKGYEVHGLIQSKSQLDNQHLKKYLKNDGVDLINFHIGDLTDTSNINRLLETIRPDEIYHLASQSHVDLSYDLPEYTIQVNALGTLRLLDAIKQSDMQTKFFNLSSCYLFDGSIVPQNEETPFNPTSPYAVSKLTSQYIVKNYRDAYGIYAVNGIFYNHESNRRQSGFVSKKIIEAVKEIEAGNDYVLHLGNLDSKREWGFASEYAYASWLMLQQDKPQDFVVGTGVVYSIREFVEEAYRQIGLNITWQGIGLNEKGYDQNNVLRIVVDSKYVRLVEPKILQSDASKFNEQTGFKLTNDLAKLIKEIKE